MTLIRPILLAIIATLFGLGACVSPTARNHINFSGSVKAGERFGHEFGEQFVFVLLPDHDGGWLLEIQEQGHPEDDLAAFTLPLHGPPNPREISGWHFRNEDNTGPNTGSVNAPQYDRSFVFSPEVPLLQKTSNTQPTESDIRRVESFGTGSLRIDQLKLSPPKRGEHAQIIEMSFHCTISWPKQIFLPIP